MHTVDARPHVLHLEMGRRLAPSAACFIHMPDAQACDTTGLAQRVHIVTSLALPLASYECATTSLVHLERSETKGKLSVFSEDFLHGLLNQTLEGKLAQMKCMQNRPAGMGPFSGLLS